MSDAVEWYLDRYRNTFPARTAVTSAEAFAADAVERMFVGADPFPYGVIDSFLPDTLLGDVLQSWERSSLALADVHLPAGGDYLGTRKTRMLVNTAMGTRCEDSAMNAVADLLLAPPLVTALLRRFAPAVEANLNDIGVTGDEAAGFRLWMNQDGGDGEALGAHVDSLNKLMTIVVYLGLSGSVTPESARIWGTTLYRRAAADPLIFSSNSGYHPVAVVDFVPNRAFVFPNGAGALHGVLGAQQSVRRDTLMAAYWLVTKAA